MIEPLNDVADELEMLRFEIDGPSLKTRIQTWLTTRTICDWCRLPFPSSRSRWYDQPKRFDLRGWHGGNPFARHFRIRTCNRCRDNHAAH